MSRISKKVVLILVLSLVFVMILAGCSKMKQDPIEGPEASAEVTNNGGLVVKQGDYLYYINGLTAISDIKFDTDNEFGTVVKGAIMRGKLNSNGELTDIKRVVPLMTLSSIKNGGIHIYGKWIYYTTPCTDKDKNDVMMTQAVNFMRTSIDGVDTQVIAKLDGVVDYKYTKDALVYTTGQDIFRISYNDKKVLDKKEGEKIASEVTGVLFPRATDASSVDEYIFYTKMSDNAEARGNVVYAQGTSKGREAYEIIGADTFDEEFQVKLVKATVEGESINIYYEKANGKVDGPSGLHRAKFTDGSFDKYSEVRLTDATVAGEFYDRASGFYVNENGVVSTIAKEEVTVGASKINVYKKTAIEGLSATSIVSFIDNYAFKDNTGAEVMREAILYINAGKLYIRAIDDTNIPRPAIRLSNEKYGVNTTWLAPEIVDGRVYFFNSEFYNYMESVSLKDGSFFEDHPLAEMNQADKDAEAAKEEK